MTTDEVIIAGLVRERGPNAACAYAYQTLRVYRQAVLNPQHFASTSQYRKAFIISYLFYKHYLRTHIIPPATDDARSTVQCSQVRQTAKAVASTIIDECEKMIDMELDGTFPASDPPSWTMGGSVVSKRHRQRIGV